MAEDEEIRLGVGEYVGAESRRGEAVVRAGSEERGGELHRRARGVALVDLELPVDRVVGPEAGVHDDLIDLLDAELLVQPERHPVAVRS